MTDALGERALLEPGRAALIAPQADGTDQRLSFQELQAQTDLLAEHFQHLGINPGHRVALMVPPSLDFFRIAFALLKLGALPVMIDPGMGLRNVGRCLAEAEPEAFIGIPPAHLARRLFGWGRATVRCTINSGARRLFCTASTTELLRRPSSGFQRPHTTATSAAAILFTSGSTGLAKGVEYTHGIFAEQVRLIRHLFQIEPGEMDFCTFPLFALFGPALGMTCIIPRMNASRPATIDPARAIATMNLYGVTNLFGSPAVLRRLGDYAARHPITVPTLRRVLSAGAPASPTILE
ncbi:MAG: AMP-binding protein, partial [Gemmataceae bacterium]